MSKSISMITASALFASVVLGALALAARNDCAAGAHSCAGQATIKKDKASFVYLTVGA